MKITQPQQHNDEQLNEVLRELSTKPMIQDVEESFEKTMSGVTNIHDTRILSGTPMEFSFIRTYVMTLSQKIIGLSVVACAVVLVVGYMMFSHSKNTYDDIVDAALEDESAYDLAIEADDTLSDIQEDDVATDESQIFATDSNISSQIAPLPVPQQTDSSQSQSIETTLTALDSLFASDDIDDSNLESWFADVSASDDLTQTYEI